jgi:hypothetical protein
LSPLHEEEEEDHDYDAADAQEGFMAGYSSDDIGRHLLPSIFGPGSDVERPLGGALVDSDDDSPQVGWCSCLVRESEAHRVCGEASTPAKRLTKLACT